MVSMGKKLCLPQLPRHPLPLFEALLEIALRLGALLAPRPAVVSLPQPPGAKQKRESTHAGAGVRARGGGRGRASCQSKTSPREPRRWPRSRFVSSSRVLNDRTIAKLDLTRNQMHVRAPPPHAASWLPPAVS